MSCLESYREGHSFLHHRDARVKLLVSLALVACLSTVGVQHPSRLAICAALLGVLLLLGRLSPGLVVRRSLIVLPFLLLPALSMPFLQTTAVSPWVMVAVIAVKSWLAAVALVALMTTTRFEDLVDGAARLGVPRLLTTLGSFMYRYLFVLLDEVRHMNDARLLRSGVRGALVPGARIAGSLVASLFVRTYDRAERIHNCMVVRGFAGTMAPIAPQRCSAADWALLALALVAMLGAVLV
jgi:cobalt/nickel transport system permease protein